MDPKVFADYLENRYEDQISYYEKASAKNQKKYKNYQWLLIILSTITTILAALPSPDRFELKYFIVITAGLVTILSSALKTFQYQELWVSYRSTIEQLRPELFYYKFNVGDYGQADIDKETLFVTRIEGILGKERESWPIYKQLLGGDNQQAMDELQRKLDAMAKDKFNIKKPGTADVKPKKNVENSDSGNDVTETDIDVSDDNAETGTTSANKSGDDTGETFNGDDTDNAGEGAGDNVKPV